MNRWLLLLLALAGAPGYSYETGIELLAEAAIAVDVETREIIYARNIDRRMFPASTTKLLTAVLLAESRSRDYRIDYTQNAKSTYPFILDLPVGDKLSAAAAMDSLLLFSANDVAVMIADDLAGDLVGFSRMMNAKAAELNMAGSRFSNPNGLHDPEHYTTAYDLSLLGRSLYRYPWIMETVAKPRSEIISANGREFRFENRNKLVQINGCVGGKTGFTPDAGKCLLALYEREGRKIVGIVLNAGLHLRDDRVFDDMSRLMDYSFAVKKKNILAPGDLIVNEVIAVDLIPGIGPRRLVTVPLIVETKIGVYPASDTYSLRYTPGNIDPWRLTPEKAVGSLILEQRDNATDYPLYPTLSWLDILRDNYFFYTAVLAGVLIVAMTAIVFLRARRR